jgi:hypothetical protein
VNEVHCFTSINLNYLAKARVLAKSVKRNNPDWVFHLLVSDELPPGFELDVRNEPFDRITWISQLKYKPSYSWIFGHDVVELCTAVKAKMLKGLLEAGASKVVYLDPDIAVFNDLGEVVEQLDQHDILLTPHQLEPNVTKVAINDNELTSLKYGIFNLGFLAVANREEGKAFAEWWEQCLSSRCYDEPTNGVFVDQKWCDLAPGFFSSLKIIRDPGYNVASWNLSRRQITVDADGQLLANGRPLKFFHFTKLGPIGDTMTRKSAGNGVVVFELWSAYRQWVEQCSKEKWPIGWWKFGYFDNGEKIPKAARELYRDRQDLQQAFPNPFRTNCSRNYFDWYSENAGASV